MSLPGMQLVFHGGKCCGIKTIYGLGYGPNAPTAIQPALEALPKRDDRDQCGWDCSSEDRFFHEEAPKESATDRLDRYIDYMKRRRPCNIVEIVIAIRNDNFDWSCQRFWPDVLKEKGFKEVNRHLNSNSGNTCAVFHLNIDEDYPGKDDSHPWDEDDDDCDDDYEDEDED